MKIVECKMCSTKINSKDTIGINKKLLGSDIQSYYCMNCLANYLECTVEDLIEKIEEFKDEGCALFV